MDDLEKRVEQFRCLELPGQPPIMHMGTSYLVSDLWKEIQRLRVKHENPILQPGSICPECGMRPKDCVCPLDSKEELKAFSK